MRGEPRWLAGLHGLDPEMFGREPITDARRQEAMTRLVFGEVVPCDACRGTGGRHGPMTADERRERAKELRKAARLRMAPPPPVRAVCGHCGGSGFTQWAHVEGGVA